MTETRTRVLNWVVSGGTAKTADGATFVIDVDPVVVGRDPGATIVVADPEVSALHCEPACGERGCARPRSREHQRDLRRLAAGA